VCCKPRHGCVKASIGLQLATLLALLALQGCGSTPAPGPAPPSRPPAAAPPVQPAPRPASLAVERQWLQSWFEGTPVRIAQRSESSFSVEVPREFCFDAGRSDVKPPLAAVLDKLAQSLQRKAESRVELLAAPGDATAASALAQQRADNVRKHLVARGVSSTQLGPPTVTGVAAVQLRIGLAAP
jgi:outer membrane protein OmpA-like peptidoglycan-associated protein